MAMKKILTVSVAAYNMEKYIRQTLDSLIVPEILDKLEVFVVDDGGTDGTLAIAQEYESRYPDTFHAVHKENGGYGSTVNYSVIHATGKYFRLLDGDDWFKTGSLKAFVELLEMINTDIIVTPFYHCIEGREIEKKNIVKGLALDTDQDIDKMKVDRVFGMWGITYQTSLLKEGGMELPAHCLYTDEIYSTVPFALAKTIRFTDIALYCYRIGRDGQSVSRESRMKHVQDKIKVCRILFDFYEEQKARYNINLTYIKRRTAAYSCGITKTYLLQPVSADVLKSIKEYDGLVKAASKDIYLAMGNYFVCKKMAIYLRMMRICRYGTLGLFFSKILIPADGIKNWA